MRYTEIKQALIEAEILDEVSMSPSSLARFANSPEAEGMLIGIEFELCVPNAQVEQEPDWEYDYNMDERAYGIDSIIDFFSNGDFADLGRNAADRLRSEMYDQHYEWQSDAIRNNLDTDELDDRIRSRLLEEIDVSDYEDEARDALGKDASDDEVYEKQKELARAAVDAKIEDEDRDWVGARDEILEEMEQEMREDGDYDDEAWLSDIGVDYMSDAEREFNVSWPHMTDANDGDGGADVEAVAQDFEDGTGWEAQGFDSYHSGSRSGQQRDKYWIIEPDASISADSGDGGLEFISPAYPLKDGLEMIKRVKAWASSYGCYTNKSTGLHMNISVPDLTMDKLDYVKLALFMGDEHVLKEFDRQYNNYCKGAMKIVREKIQRNPENATQLLNTMKQHLNTAASKLVHQGATDKFTSINTKDKYVEFRGPGGDYLDKDVGVLLNTAMRLAQSLYIATTETAYKQEYAKKLYKLVAKEGEWTDPNHSVALFSRYALGEIDKAELVDNIRQAQVARKEKKGPEQQFWVMNKDGSGGKQMVFATSPTNAILKGGSQMGYDREKSIKLLKAELMEKPQDSSVAPASVSESWKDWVKDTMPEVNVDTLNSVRQRMVHGTDFSDADARGWIIDRIDDELRSRQDQGVVDGNETRWKVVVVWNRRGPSVPGYEPVYVDADSPRQAKIKAAPIFKRQMNLSDDVNIENLEATVATAEEGQPEREWTIINGLGEPAGTVQARTGGEALHKYGTLNDVDTRYYRATPVETAATTSREVFDSLADNWQEWLQGVPRHTDGNLQRIIDNMAQGVNAHYTNLSLDQKDFILNTVRQEQQRRTGNNATAQAAGSAENAVRDSLPEAHRDWIANVATHSDMGLINVLRNVAVSELLSDQQAAYFRVRIKHELRRRGINPDTDTEPVQQQGELDFNPPTNTYADDAAERERMRGEREQLSREFTPTPDAPRAGPGQSTYSVEYIPTGNITQVVGNDAADAIERQARASGIDARGFRIATNESVNTLRRLAGLK